MSGATMVRVRVRRERALSLPIGAGQDKTTVLHVAGAELELDVDEANALEEQGFVEQIDTPMRALGKKLGRGAEHGELQ